MANDYMNGGQGMTKWVEDCVCFPIYEPGSDLPIWMPANKLSVIKNPETGRSPMDMWEKQKEVLHEALEMKGGKFKYNLIVFCWMRGESKSFLVCLIQLWKFFNWPKQQIMLGANSKDQVKFVHYDIMRDIILNSPKLLNAVGKKNIREKEIRIRDQDGNVVSFLRTISTATGIVSNITGYTFSEVFDMKKPKFFNQLDGSMRNVPNALGVIDSTVSTKTHFLYDKLYRGWLSGDIKRLYFSYRFSKDADSKDYWHPYMTQASLNDYSSKMMASDFDRYFRNIWSTGSDRLITERMIAEMGYMGNNEGMLNHQAIMQVLNEHGEEQKRVERVEARMRPVEHLEFKYLDGTVENANAVLDSLKPVDDYYRMDVKDSSTRQIISLDEILRLGDMLSTDFALLVGMDMGDPLQTKGQSRSILSLVMKCLPGSRGMKYLLGEEGSEPAYYYFLVGLVNYLNHSLEDIKNDIDYIHTMYDGVDRFTSERWGAWNMIDWCAAREIPCELVYPNYERQKEAFKELSQSLKFGRFKAPRVGIIGSKSDDILREEMGLFDHESESDTKGRFFSPEKFLKDGVQDDVMYSIAWGIYGGRNVTVGDFQMRHLTTAFGEFIGPHKGALVGRY